ncbi:hypothetical protein [Chryseolinea soli]|uniref:Uncharacterized protein n=1 Tax=Chryseolinea soli TaxID=2321403 RepID=A0A385SFQ4_9BACT|nr:hypothetical protein [Chryseolinea soli]AYB29712.1 hypothetical protein D4L85_03560 [Chryseolinea soli]
MSGQKTIDLLSALQEVRTLLTTIELMEMKHHAQSGDPADAFHKMITLSYDVLKLKLFIDKKLPKQEGHSPALYLQVTFEISGNKLEHTGLYCEKRDREPEIIQFIQHTKPPGGFLWGTEKRDVFYTDRVMQYLALADTIALQAQHCSAGDDYRPGYYSEIVLEDERIHLKQINHWNARSIDHRDDYFMRNLEFDIPLQPVATQSSQLYDTLGDMQIYFSDRSSDNNKSCGHKIQEQIQNAKMKFAESSS